MGSSGGGDDGMGMMALMGQGTPMPGLPIAGQGAGVDPTTYGKYQSFLPEPLAEGPNPMATGLRPDMLKFRSPGSSADASSGGGGDPNSPEGMQARFLSNLRNEVGGGGGGGVGTMGMSRRIGPAFGPSGDPVAMQGQYGGTDQYGRGNFSSGPTEGPVFDWRAQNAGFSGSNVGPPGDPRIAAGIAANMAANGGQPQKTNFGVPGAATSPEWQPGMPIPKPSGV
jgi:hypothetical protein